MLCWSFCCLLLQFEKWVLWVICVLSSSKGIWYWWFLYFHSRICISSFFLLVNLLCTLFNLHGSISPCYIQIFCIQFILDILNSCSSFSLLSSNLFYPGPKFAILCLLVDYLLSQGFHSQPVPLLLPCNTCIPLHCRNSSAQWEHYLSLSKPLLSSIPSFYFSRLHH